MRAIFLILTTAACVFAQSVITVSASRAVAIVPDQVAYSVGVQTGSSGRIDDALAQLSGTGITAKDLSYVESTAGFTTWTFELLVPFSRMKETSAVLARLPQANASFSISGARTSQDAAAQACQYTALVSDARREADRLASAAGVHVG